MAYNKKQTQKDKIQTYGIMKIPITEELKDASILLGHEMSRQDIKDVFDLIKGKVDVKYRDDQRKDSRHLVKQLVDAKLKEMKKQGARVPRLMHNERVSGGRCFFGQPE